MDHDKMTGIQLGLERAKTDFFEYNGKKYPAGTMFRMKNPKFDFLNDVTAVFIGSLPELHPGKLTVAYNDDVAMASNFAYKNCKKWKTMIPVEKDKLANMIVEILPGNYYVEMERNHKKYESDFDDPNLMAKWGMYLAAMAITSIFNGRIFGWIVWTVIFFAWRHKYKKENCVYYE